MKKTMLLVVLSGMLMGTSCQSLPCSNDLDGSTYGFTLTIPAEFTCAQSISGSMLGSPYLAVLIYRDDTHDRSVTVMVLEHQDGDGQANTSLTCGDSSTYTTPAPNSIEFGVKKCTSTQDGSIAYTGGAEITAGGNVLGVSVGGKAADDPATLEAILDGILDTVQFTGT